MLILSPDELLKLEEVAKELNATFENVESVHNSGSYTPKIYFSGYHLFITKRYGAKRHFFLADVDSIYGHPLYNRPSIGVSLTRSSSAIAKDLKRRLLTDAKEWAQDVRNDFLKQEREKSDTERIIQQLLTANNCSQKEAYRTSDKVFAKGAVINKSAGIPDYKGTFNLNISVNSLKCAEMIMALAGQDADFHLSKS